MISLFYLLLDVPAASLSMNSVDNLPDVDKCNILMQYNKPR